VIEQSSFKYGFTQISIFLHCPIDKSVCTIIQSLHAHLSYHHKIHFESGSTSIHAALNSFPVQSDISNIVTHGKQQISLITLSKTPYMVRIILETAC